MNEEGRSRITKRRQQVHHQSMIVEEGTRNKTIVNTFNTLWSNGFPCRRELLVVFVALTNGQGKQAVRLSLRHGETQLGAVELPEVDFEHPNKVVELTFNLRNLIFLEPGLHTFEVSVGSEYVFESRINVNLKQPNS